MALRDAFDVSDVWARWKKRRAKAAWDKERNNAMVRASNGEHLPRQEREMYDLPDWTG